MNQIELKNIDKGEFFTLKAIKEPAEEQVYIKGYYDKSSKTYSCINYSDSCKERFLKGDRLVFVGFTF